MRSAFRRWLHRGAGVIRSRQAREVQDELDSHLQLHIDDNRRRGMSAEDARREALIALGGVTQAAEAYRDQSTLPLVETAVKDVTFALRLARRNPGFSAIVIATLAIGIGANTVMFSVVNSLLLKALPYAQPERLVALQIMESVRWQPVPAAPPDFYRYRERNRSFDHIEAYYARPANLTGGRQPERLPTLIVSAGLLDAVGTPMALGRGFVRQDEQWGSHRVAVLTAGLWERRFGASPGVVGTAIALNGESFQVVGILPRTFSFLGLDAQIFLPMAFKPGDNMNTHSNNFLWMIGRLAPGVTPQQAAADLNAILARTVAEQSVNQGKAMDVVPLRDIVVGHDVRRALIVLLGAVGVVLLITCANLANLLLSRAAARQREISVRFALGASRARLVRQFLSESLLLSLTGGVAGLLVAYGSVDALNLVSQRVLPRAGTIEIDGIVLLFSMLLAAGAGVLLGLVPAAHGAGDQVNAGLKSATRSSTDGPGRGRVRGVLVAAEVALTVMLLAGAGLMTRSLYELLHIPAGFDAEAVLTLQLNLPPQKYIYSGPEQRGSAVASSRATDFFTAITDRGRGMPGVTSVGAINGLPLMGEVWGKSLTLWDRPLPKDVSKLPSMQYRVVVGDYFKALGIRIIAGRPFTDDDNLRSPKVAIVSHELARRFWSGGDPVGKVLSVNPPLELLPKSLVEEARRAGTISPDYAPDRFTIVGVADDVRYASLETAPGPVVYVPYAQGSEGSTNMYVVVRTAGDPLALAGAFRQEVTELDSDQPVAGIQTMSARVAASVAQRRVQMNVLGAFAGVAVLIAVVGIYGVMSYSVAQRSREIGIRLALGAARSDVVGVIMRQGMAMVAAGMVLGVGASLAFTRVLRALLFGVSPTDPLVFSAVVILLGLTAAAAIYVPARRAAGLDPLEMLRREQ